MQPREVNAKPGVAMKQAMCAGLVALIVLLVLVEAGLQVEEKKCGQITCDSMKYCDEHTRMCNDCSVICRPNTGNYDRDSCENQCQDYIHQQKFVTRADFSSGEEMNSKVTRLTVIVVVNLVILVLVLLALLLVLYWLYRYRKFQGPPAYTKSHGVENGNLGGGLKISMPPPPPPSTTAPPATTPATTSTPLSTRPRFPKEDPTLEYGAYDNPALAPSPVFENNGTPPTATTTPVSRRQESSF